MAMNMTRGFGRECILSTIDIDGYYRFGDVFQIIALDDSHPKPPTRGLGHFPLAIEYSFNLNEEQRSQLLEGMCVEGPETFRNGLIDGSYCRSKRDELVILLTLFTPSLFFVYNRTMQRLSWFVALGSDCHEMCWGQSFYAPGDVHIADQDDFSEPNMREIPQSETLEYYSRLFTYPGQNCADVAFSLPDSADTLFETYYGLEQDAQSAFLRASTLFYQGMKIWFESRSLTYTALVSCLETLIHYEYRGVKHAPCERCATTQYQVMKKFRAFLDVDDLPSGDVNRKYVKELYDFRSQILHRGYILAGDSSAPGYCSLTEADEDARLMHLVSITRRRLIRWLLEQ